jgi:Icc-related predicted phosphoesterase
VVIDGIKIYGFPWLNQYDIAKVRRNAYVVSSFDMDYRLANIPADTRILVTHGPPHKVLDMVQKTSIDRPVYIGGGMLGKAVGQLKPAIHVFGHAHSGHGVKLNNGTISVNAALCNTRNEVAHMPVVVNFDPEHPEQSTVGFVYQPLAKKKA